MSLSLRWPHVRHTGLAAALLAVTACGGSPESAARRDAATPTRSAGTPLVVADTTIGGAIDVAGVAEAMRQASLGTKLMGTVTAVLVQPGDVVHAGQVLVRIDARDVTARGQQVAAALADAEALRSDAATHAARMRALFADSAATRAQFDAAQTGLARADAAVRAARASGTEVEAMQSYAAVRAPFDGVVTARLVDPGAFAAPGAPLVTVQDVSQLRLRVTAAAGTLRSLARGQEVAATIDGIAVPAQVEGIVPGGTGNLFAVSAIVPNRRGAFRAGSVAVLSLPTAPERVLTVPVSAVIREGDLTGVLVRGATGDERRWIRLGAVRGGQVEVTSGLVAGETIVVPPGVGAPPSVGR